MIGMGIGHGIAPPRIPYKKSLVECSWDGALRQAAMNMIAEEEVSQEIFKVKTEP